VIWTCREKTCRCNTKSRSNGGESDRKR